MTKIGNQLSKTKLINLCGPQHECLTRVLWVVYVDVDVDIVVDVDVAVDVSIDVDVDAHVDVDHDDVA